LVASAENGKEAPRDRFLLRLEELLEVFGGRRLLHEDEELLAGAYLLVPALLAVDPGVQGAGEKGAGLGEGESLELFQAEGGRESEAFGDDIKGEEGNSGALEDFGEVGEAFRVEGPATGVAVLPEPGQFFGWDASGFSAA
jgi:hypothetical protein